MHRHSYQGRKLNMTAAPRKALVRGMLTSLVMQEAVVTTEAKAKEVAPAFERLVTKAKKGDLSNARAVRSVLFTEVAAQKMLYELAPSWKDRSGGYTRIIKLAPRRGDNAAMAQLSLVLPEKSVEKPKADAKAKPKAESKTESKAKAAAKPKAAAKAGK